MQKPILIYSGKFDKINSNVYKLLEFCGIGCELLKIENKGLNLKHTLEKATNKKKCLMISGKSLVEVEKILNEKKSDVKDYITYNFNSIFVFGLYEDISINSILKDLTDGIIRSVSSFKPFDSSYEIVSNQRSICDTFSGLVIKPVNFDTDLGFEFENKSKKMSNLIEISNKSLFLKISECGCNMFFLACKEIIDISTFCVKKIDVRKYFSQLIPIMMFIKSTFKGYVWENNTKSACFIIDDPLLKPAYGFLSFNKLLYLMEKHNFSMNIAFIPWNYKRSDKRVTNMIAKEHPKYSVSMHGCDHIDKEFATNDNVEISARLDLAKYRMKKHFEETRMPFDNVMVFPQGIFSVEALRMLKEHGFLSAVNTDILPYNCNSFEIMISELLNPAILFDPGFPMFTRRYPSDKIENFAFDLFLGKPCFIVEHHNYFKEGCESAVNFIKEINSLDQNLCWSGLGDIVKRTYLRKNISKKIVAVRIFTCECIIENTNEYLEEYVITKVEPEVDAVKSVLINDKKWPHYFNNDLLHLTVRVKPKETIRIRLFYFNKYKDSSFPQWSLNYSTKTAIRRYLSEFRDNFLAKNDIILSIAEKFKSVIS